MRTCVVSGRAGCVTCVRAACLYGRLVVARRLPVVVHGDDPVFRTATGEVRYTRRLLESSSVCSPEENRNSDRGGPL